MSTDSRNRHFDNASFVAALDTVRVAKGMTWRKVGDASGVSPSTLTRMRQGRRPDVDSFAALLSWSGLNSEDFIVGMRSHSNRPAMVEVVAIIRSDPSLSADDALTLEGLLVDAYERLRANSEGG